MKIKLLLIFLFLITLYAYSIEYNTYDMEQVFAFKASNLGLDNISDLAIVENPRAGEELGPVIYFDKESLVIADQANKYRRTIYLNDDFTFDKIVKDSFYASKNQSFEDYIIGRGKSHITLFDKTPKWEVRFWLSDDDFIFLRRYKDSFYQENTLFIFDENNTLWAIKDPSLDNEKNKANIISEEDIIKDINEGKYKGLTIDDKKRLFLDGELQTINYKTFMSLLLDKNQKIAGKIKGFVYEYSLLARFAITTYSCKDNDGNNYWSTDRTFIIYSPDGKLVDLFRYDSNLSDTYPAVSPEGDIYFLKYGEDKVTLYKIKRQW